MYSGRNTPDVVAAEYPKVSCVRSFVPKLKKSATSAISSAVTAARGISIIVPILISTPTGEVDFLPRLADGLLALAEHRELLLDAHERDHDLGDRPDLALQCTRSRPR
jgi:hypothetical protein